MSFSLLKTTKKASSDSPEVLRWHETIHIYVAIRSEFFGKFCGEYVVDSLGKVPQCICQRGLQIVGEALEEPIYLGLSLNGLN